ncbi:hypothetical protein [Gallaecimonas mangrovi]|nr:hypothetical protein [Gallaecimonas mangrovi]
MQVNSFGAITVSLKGIFYALVLLLIGGLAAAIVAIEHHLTNR